MFNKALFLFSVLISRAIKNFGQLWFAHEMVMRMRSLGTSAQISFRSNNVGFNIGFVLASHHAEESLLAPRGSPRVDSYPVLRAPFHAPANQHGGMSCFRDRPLVGVDACKREGSVSECSQRIQGELTTAIVQKVFVHSKRGHYAAVLVDRLLNFVLALQAANVLAEVLVPCVLLAIRSIGALVRARWSHLLTAQQILVDRGDGVRFAAVIAVVIAARDHTVRLNVDHGRVGIGPVATITLATIALAHTTLDHVLGGEDNIDRTVGSGTEGGRHGLGGSERPTRSAIPLIADHLQRMTTRPMGASIEVLRK